MVASEVPEAIDASHTSYLLLRLHTELYGLPGTCVREVARWRAYTEVPGASATLPGIISQRGFVLPVVNLYVLLNIPSTTPSPGTRYVIVKHADVDIALIADTVLDLVDLPTTADDPSSNDLSAAQTRIVSGIVRFDNEPAALLDMAALIAVLRSGD